MFNYEEFKSVIADHIKDYLPEEYVNGSVEIRKVNKTNQVLDGMYIKTDQPYAVTLYLNPMYEQYRQGRPLDELLEEAAALMTQAETQFEKKEITSDFIRENVYLCLINRKSNEALLSTVPYKKYQDLAIIYRIRYGTEGTGLVTKKLQESLKIGEEELYALALQNTKRLYPPVAEDMNEFAMKELGVSQKEIQELISEVPDEYRMYVVSNTEKFHGAASVLYGDILQELAETIGSDLYLLPSSIHEMLVVSSRNQNLQELSAMVQNVNYHEVPLKDQLSNNVYHYDRKQRCISLATDVKEPLRSSIKEPLDIGSEIAILGENQNKIVRNPGRNR